MAQTATSILGRRQGRLQEVVVNTYPTMGYVFQRSPAEGLDVGNWPVRLTKTGENTAELRDISLEDPETMDVTLYTRTGCHLCDEALQTLILHGLQPTLVDIDENKDLIDRFNTCVPVVEIDGKVRFRGRVDPVLLKRLLKNSQ